MKTALQSTLKAGMETHEARSLAEILLFTAESASDADFARLRLNHVSLLYMLIEKLTHAEAWIDEVSPSMGEVLQ